MLRNGPYRLLLVVLRLTTIRRKGGENVLRIDASLTDEQLEKFLRRQLAPFGSVKEIRLMSYVADDHRLAIIEMRTQRQTVEVASVFGGTHFGLTGLVLRLVRPITH